MSTIPPFPEPSSMRASKSARDLACPGNLILAEGMTNESSEYAAEGTAAHTLLELCQRFEMEPAEFLGETIDVDEGDGKSFQFAVNESMVEAVAVFLQWCEDNVPTEGRKFELGLDGSKIGLPMVTGHIDFVCFFDGVLWVVDFKYGAGVPVSAADNKQLLTYAMLSIADMHVGVVVREVRLAIIQPRVEGGISEWNVTTKDVNDHRVALMDVTNKVGYLQEYPDELPNYVATGSHCQFCPATAKCPAMQSKAVAIAATNFEVSRDITPDQMAFWLDNSKHVENWLEAVRKLAKSFAEKGGTVPGYKVVESLSRREWNGTDDEIEASLRAEGFRKKDLREPPKLKGPSQIEKLDKPSKFKTKKARDEFVTSLTRRSVRGTTIVKDSDKRPAIGDPCDDFDDVEF